MASFDDYSSLGVGVESFFLMEDESPAAEVEVKLNGEAAEDQQDDASADTAAASADATSDAGAELFKDVARIANIEKVLSSHDLHPSLYAFLNTDGQLDRLLKVQLPGVESLSSTSSNSETINTIIPKLETLFKTNASENISKFFGIMAAKLNKMRSTTDKVVITRAQRVAEMIARLEQDDAPEEVTVSTSDTAEAADTADAAEAPASTEPAAEPVDVDANTAEECNKIMQCINVTGLKDTVMITSMDAAINGDAKSMNDITDYVRKSMSVLSKYRQLSHTNRFITYNKADVLKSLRYLKRELSNWANVDMLHFACQNLAKQNSNISINGSESFNKVLPKYKALSVLHNYLQVSKKIMDAAYYNLRFATYKLLANHK